MTHERRDGSVRTMIETRCVGARSHLCHFNVMDGADGEKASSPAASRVVDLHSSLCFAPQKSGAFFGAEETETESHSSFSNIVAAIDAMATTAEITIRTACQSVVRVSFMVRLDRFRSISLFH